MTKLLFSKKTWAYLPFMAFIIWALFMPVITHAMDLDTDPVETIDSDLSSDSSAGMEDENIQPQNDTLTPDGTDDDFEEEHDDDYPGTGLSQNGYCGNPNINGGMNVLWSLSRPDSSIPCYLLTIKKNPDASVSTDDHAYDMADFAQSDVSHYDVPWEAFRDDITEIEIEDGVTSIGEGSFYNHYGVTSVSIGNDVKSIGCDAFDKCSALATVTGGDNVERVDDDAFGYVDRSNNNPIPWISNYESGKENVVVYVGKTAIGGLDIKNNADIEVKDGTISVGANFFIGQPIRSIKFPDSLKYIDDYAFMGCAWMPSVTIPASVEEIGYAAFNNCVVLTSVYLTGENPARLAETHTDYTFTGSQGRYDYLGDQNLNFYYMGDAYVAEDSQWLSMWDDMKQMHWTGGYYPLSGYCGKADENSGKNVMWAVSKSEGSADYDTLTIYPNPEVTDEDANFDMVDYTTANYTTAPWYIYKDTLITVSIEAGVTSVGDYDFYSDYDSLKTVSIGDDVITIGNWAFRRDDGITTLTVGNSVENINECAFYECKLLSSVNIPASVTYIGGTAFAGCVRLYSVNFAPSDAELYIGCGAFGRTAWYDNQSQDAICIRNVLYGYKDHDATEYQVPDGITLISSGAFADDLVNLGRVILPDSLKIIGENAFHGCTGISEIVIPANVTDIGNNAFENCDNLNRMILLPSTPPTLDSNGLGIGISCLFVHGNAYAADGSAWKNFDPKSFWIFDESTGIHAEKCEILVDVNGVSCIKENTVVDISGKDTPPEGYGEPLVGYEAFDADGNSVEITENNGTYSLTMPASDVTPRGIWTKVYGLTVSGGTFGDNKTCGEFAEGTDITITANAPATGKKFTGWTGLDDITITSGDTSSTSVTFKMPKDAVNVAAVFEDILYPLTVNNGTGDGNYIYNKNVTITADNPAAGKKFKEWIGTDGLTFVSSNKNSVSATFKMPARAVTVTANYEDIIYTVTASNDGHGTASASPVSGKMGTKVTISACPKTGYTFKEWKVISGGVTLADKTKEKTTFSIKTSNVEVKAVFAKKTTPDPGKTSIKNAKITLSKTSYTYNSKEQKPTIKKVTVNGRALSGKDYTVTWPKKPVNAGTYTITLKGKGDYTGQASVTYKITKASNTLKVGVQKDTYKVTYADLKKKNQTIKGSKIYKFTDKKKTKGDITYSLSSVKQGKKSVKKGFTIEKKDGKLKIKKSVAKGKYTVNVKVAAAGNKNYNKATKTVSFTVNIK